MSTGQKILAFSWNAEGLRICETANQATADKKRKGFFHKLIGLNKCLVPDFFEEIKKSIQAENPVIVAISTEEEANNETYFHSDYLPVEMKDLGYIQYYREKLKSVGMYSISSSKKNLDFPTGNPGKTALRFSVYVRSDVFDGFEERRNGVEKIFTATQIYDPGTRSGALACYLQHEDLGVFCFVAAHHPNRHLFVTESSMADYQRTRGASVIRQNGFVQTIINEFYENEVKHGMEKPDYFFLLGDLGYNVSTENLKHSLDLTTLRNEDELKLSGRTFSIALSEGEGGRGPQFAPTWALRRGRKLECNEKKCYEGLIVGWRDRILYHRNEEAPLDLNCVRYSKISSKTIDRTRHNAVMGIFDVHW